MQPMQRLHCSPCSSSCSSCSPSPDPPLSVRRTEGELGGLGGLGVGRMEGARAPPAGGGGMPDLRGALRRQEGVCVADHLAGSVPGSGAAGSGGAGPAVRPLGVPAAVGALRAPVLQDDWASYLGEFRKGP